MIESAGKKRYRGVPVEYGDGHLIVPALNLNRAEQMSSIIDEVSATKPADVKSPMTFISEHQAKIIHCALQMNYPDITMEEVKDILTLDNVQTMFAAALGRSGVSQKVKDVGEIKPAADGPISTGTASAGAS